MTSKWAVDLLSVYASLDRHQFAMVDDCQKLDVIQAAAAEIERLRGALQAIVARTKGGAGAAVCVTPQTLADIVRKALEVSDEPLGT